MDNSDDQQRLLWAATSGDLKEVQRLVNVVGVDVETRDGFGYTPISNAVICEELEVAEFLIDHGADVNIRDKCGQTPLLWAANDGNLETVEFLVTRCGADAEVKDNRGKTPLSFAADRGHLEIVEFLEEVTAQKKQAATNVGDLTKSAARR